MPEDDPEDEEDVSRADLEGPRKVVDRLVERQEEEARRAAAEAERRASRRRFLAGAGLVGIGGTAGYFVGDFLGPSALLGQRAVRGFRYVVFQADGEVRAQDGDTGTVEFRGTASDVLEGAAEAMAQGGTLLVRGGTYQLRRAFPGEAMPDLRLVGEGRATRLENDGQPFDTLDLARAEVRDLTFLDRNGVACYTGLASHALPRATQGVPFGIRGAEVLPDTEVRRLGDYVRVRTTAAGAFPAISTGHAIVNRGGADRSLRVRAVVRLVPPTESAIPFFAEPFKSDFDNFFGFIWNPPSTLLTLTRSGGSETATPHSVSPDLMEGDHAYEIEYRLGSVTFYLDGTVLGQHTTNISPPPHEWSAAEPNGTVMSCYLKHPYFEIVTV